MATHNGRRWLPEQLESILNQEGVDVRIIAADDESDDGTAEYLAEVAATDTRVSILATTGRSGGAAANFYRLLGQADYRPDEFVAFADQDDIWMPGKLARHARLLVEGGLDGVSSEVTSFTPDGKRTRVRKSFPQRRFDYLLESPGPGSTFLLSYRLAELARQVLTDSSGAAARVEFHDSLLYVFGRASGWKWHIDCESTVDYRQHETNVMGANVSVRSAFARFTLIRQGWLRNHARLLAEVAIAAAPAETRPELEAMQALFVRTDWGARWALARRAGQLRRRVRDQWIIAVLVLAGIW